jgi:hypothetical protein
MSVKMGVGSMRINRLYLACGALPILLAVGVAILTMGSKKHEEFLTVKTLALLLVSLLPILVVRTKWSSGFGASIVAVVLTTYFLATTTNDQFQLTGLRSDSQQFKLLYCARIVVLFWLIWLTATTILRTEAISESTHYWIRFSANLAYWICMIFFLLTITMFF